MQKIVHRIRKTGGTLAEAIIAMALLSFILMGTYMFAYQGANSMTSMSDKSGSMMDVQSVLNEIQQRIANGSRIDSQSTSQNLIIDSIDAYNNVIKATYTISGGYLSESYQQSGSSWSSTTPYLTGSDNTKYKITSGEFLYCGYQNNCTKFTTAGGAGTLIPNTGDASLSPAGPANSALAHSGSAPLNDPAQATKILLYDFTFQKNSGTTPVTRTIKDTFARLGPPQVSYGGTVLQYFDYNNGSFPNVQDFDGGLYYDAPQRRLLVSGSSASHSYIYSVTRNGIKLSYGNQLSGTPPSPANWNTGAWVNGLALESDGNTLLALNGGGTSTLKLYIINLTTTSFSSINLASLGFIKSTYYGSSIGIAYDPNTPNDFYMCGVDNTTGQMQIYERQIADGTASTASPNSWALPPYDSATKNGVSTNICGLTIDPVTGDFYLAQNNISQDVRIFHIKRASSTTDDHFDILLSGSSTTYTSSNIPSTTSGPNKPFNISYDPTTNHIFLEDGNNYRIFEILPSRLISPRS